MPHQYSLIDHYRTDPAYAGSPQTHRTGGSFGLNMMDVDQAAVDTVDPAVSEYAFVTTTGPPRTASVDFGDGWREGALERTVVDIQPASTACAIRAPALRLRVVTIPADTLCRLLGDMHADIADYSAAIGQFRRVPRAAAQLNVAWNAAEQGGSASNIAVDAAFLSMLAELLRVCGNERTAVESAFLANEQIARVVDYVEAFLAEPLTMGRLAGVAGIPMFEFGAMFKNAFGETPHCYVTRRRIERAKCLLRTTDYDADHIAEACGFPSRSALGSSFRAFMGTTPNRFRESCQVNRVPLAVEARGG